ncbi:MAG: ABC transporter ATP-binding protein [Acidimicrobiia bacterium]
MPFVIEAKNLEKAYGAKRALNGFNLNVEKGIIFGLLGPNGAGKTTAIEIMLGLRKSDNGNISVLGENPEKHFGKISPRIGAMLQEGGINPGLKPIEAIKLYRSFYPDGLDANELIRDVDLEGITTPVRRLSGGQAQSLSLALAIVGKPDLVFLDEPTVGMDPRARRRTWDIIKKLKDSGTTVILTTHLMDEAEQLCDEIAIVSKGRVIAQGDTQTLTSSSQNNIEVEFSDEVNGDKVADFILENVSQKTSRSIVISSESNPQLFLKLAQYSNENNLTVTKYSADERKLEDVFIELTDES